MEQFTGVWDYGYPGGAPCANWYGGQCILSVARTLQGQRSVSGEGGKDCQGAGWGGSHPKTGKANAMIIREDESVLTNLGG